MEGRAQAAKRDVDLAILGAWHAVAFDRTKKLQKLSAYLDTGKPSQRASHAHAIAFFHRLKAQGLPVKITRNEIN
jgi:hypothetical protein